MNNVLDMSNAKIVGMTGEVRARECLAGIQHLCSQYRCEIVPVITLVGSRGVQAGIQVMPLPDNDKIISGGK
jgi:hypothetical protein